MSGVPDTKQFTTMATKRTKTERENLKKQMETIIETAQYTDTRSWRGDTREVYTMHHSGTFTAEYEIRPTGWTRAEMEEELRRRARKLASRRMLPKGMDDRSNRLQRAMAFIGEHRELIPLLRYCHHLTSGGRRISFTDIVVLYTRTATLPDMVYYQDRDYHIKGVGYRCSSGITHISELIEQVPYLPKAWRCA